MEMEPVGFLGVIKLTTLIIRKNLKHFAVCMAIICAIPCAFHLHPLDASELALHFLVSFSTSLKSLTVQVPPFPASLPPTNDTDLIVDPFFFPIMAWYFFSITISIILQPLLAFSVCRACLNKSISLKGSALGILRSAKNLALTSLCIGVVLLGFFAMTVGMTAIIPMMVILAVRGNVNETLTTSIVVPCTVIVLAIGGVYMTISFSLAHTVAILEEKMRGWGAMKRSMDLLAGRKWVALGLVCALYGLSHPLRMSGLWRWRGATTVNVSLQAGLWGVGMVARVVLYMACKREREEPLNTLIAAGAQFGSPESAPASMDVETAALLPALPK